MSCHPILFFKPAGLTKMKRLTNEFRPNNTAHHLLNLFFFSPVSAHSATPNAFKALSLCSCRRWWWYLAEPRAILAYFCPLTAHLLLLISFYLQQRMAVITHLLSMRTANHKVGTIRTQLLVFKPATVETIRTLLLVFKPAMPSCSLIYSYWHPLSLYIPRKMRLRNHDGRLTRCLCSK